MRSTPVRLFISFPADRVEYRPPAGADLAARLTEHAILQAGSQQPAAEVRQPDGEIAGSLAIHTRFERSPQSHAYNKYFFAHDGQIYVVVLVHTGDRVDWGGVRPLLAEHRI